MTEPILFTKSLIVMFFWQYLATKLWLERFYTQALLKLGESREDRLRRVTLQVNQDDVIFALQVCIIDVKHYFSKFVLYVAFQPFSRWELSVFPSAYLLSNLYLNVEIWILLRITDLW